MLLSRSFHLQHKYSTVFAYFHKHQRTMASTQTLSASLGSTANSEGPPSHCSQQTVLTIAWSDDNPGRRFYKCEENGFVVWHDKERPCSWQKKSVLEAREKILTQTEEIKALCAALRQANAKIAALEISRSSGPISETLKSIEDHVTVHINETERMVRKLILYSGGGLP